MSIIVTSPTPSGSTLPENQLPDRVTVSIFNTDITFDVENFSTFTDFLGKVKAKLKLHGYQCKDNLELKYPRGQHTISVMSGLQLEMVDEDKVLSVMNAIRIEAGEELEIIETITSVSDQQVEASKYTNACIEENIVEDSASQINFIAASHRVNTLIQRNRAKGEGGVQKNQIGPEHSSNSWKEFSRKFFKRKKLKAGGPGDSKNISPE